MVSDFSEEQPSINSLGLQDWEMVKLLKSRVLRLEQPLKTPIMALTFSVLKLLTSMLVNWEQFLNMELMAVTFDVSKWSKPSMEDKLVQSWNMLSMVVTFDVSKLLTSILEMRLLSLNIEDMSVTCDVLRKDRLAIDIKFGIPQNQYAQEVGLAALKEGSNTTLLTDVLR